ncbi:MAG: hypothetical protein EDM75_03130 [Chlorobiota bacterium]|nr:MAG: hypothetical protein EDM75_03130 [Chlorobiota bacterium]
MFFLIIYSEFTSSQLFLVDGLSVITLSGENEDNTVIIIITWNKLNNNILNINQYFVTFFLKET